LVDFARNYNNGPEVAQKKLNNSVSNLKKYTQDFSRSSGLTLSVSASSHKPKRDIFDPKLRPVYMARSQDIKRIKLKRPDLTIIDITYRTGGKRQMTEWAPLSDVYNHEDIAVPRSKMISCSVRAIYEAAKEFNLTGKNLNVYYKQNGIGIIRKTSSVDKTVLRWVVEDIVIEDKMDARNKLLAEPYKQIIESRCKERLEELREMVATGTEIILVDTSAANDFDWNNAEAEHPSVLPLLRALILQETYPPQ